MFLHYLIEYQTLAYWIIFFGMMVEGDILLFSIGFLVHQGYFAWDKTLLIVFLGVMIGDNLWYALGELLSNRKIALTLFTNRLIGMFDNHLKNRTARTIFISKFVYGFHRPMLIRAGSLRLSFKEFIRGDFSASIIWIFIIGGLGYLSGASFFAVKKYLRYTEISLLLVVTVFIAISYIASRISKRKL